MIAYLYNQNMQWHNGNLEAVMFIKNISDHGFYFDGVATLDIEGSRADRLLAEHWQTDHSIGPWGYYAGARYRPVTEIIHELVDIVSKNGNLLLNVPPRADGTLDEQTEEILRAIGRWNDVNGEAIFDTSPWIKYGEGNFRFTKKGKTLYVISLEWSKSLNVSSLGKNENVGKVSNVTLLGYNGKLEWDQKNNELSITLPDNPPCEHAYSFRVNFE
jgi:alpha-L-fucosidase